MADGNIVYQGQALESAEYFTVNLNAKSSKFANPADIFMKILSLNYPKTEEDVQKLELFNSCY
jgi:hypothetical protein